MLITLYQPQDKGKAHTIHFKVNVLLNRVNQS